MGRPPTPKNIMPRLFPSGALLGLPAVAAGCWGFGDLPLAGGGGASHGGADGDDLLRVHLARVPAVSHVRSHPHDLPFRDRADIHLTAIRSAHADMRSARAAAQPARTDIQPPHADMHSAHAAVRPARGGEWIFGAILLPPMD
jgi:hypothetical protein